MAPVDERRGFVVHSGSREMNAVDVSAILAALQEQLGCYRKLARLAEAQHEHVQQMNMEPLLEVLRARQLVLNRLGELQHVLGAGQRRWMEIAANASPDDRVRGDECISETRRLLEQITEADRNDALVLQQRKLSVGRQINQASAARQVNRTYAMAAYGPRASTMDVQH